MRNGFRLACSLAVMACLGVVAILIYGEGLNRWHIASNCLLSVAILAGASAVMLRCLPPLVVAYGMGYRDGRRDAEAASGSQPVGGFGQSAGRRLRAVSRS